MKYIKQLLVLLTIISFTNCTSDKEYSNPLPDIGIYPTVGTVTTNVVSNITINTATAGGNVTSDGGSPITVRGVVWSLLPNPTIQLTTKTLDGTGTGSFDSALINLISNTTYYIRAYATNAVGTVYGNELSFTTPINPADLPVVTTNALTEITTTSVISGGKVTSSGASPVTSRGVVWSLTTNPTLVVNNGISTNGIGLGPFVNTITNLTPNTIYYVRAYATNSQGTAYGDEVSFTTSPLLYSVGNGVTDIDGTNYTSIIINNQEWTTSNLNVTKYSDGTVIPQIQNAADWAALTTGAWCYYAFQSSNGLVYAKLYNWYAVAGIWNDASKTDVTLRKKLAPTGWHFATDSEWSSLITFLGDSQTAGGFMKEAGYIHWQSPNTNATNSSGINGLPGGACLTNGTFSNLGTIGNWWSADEYNPTSAYCSSLYNDSAKASRAPINKKSGFSVRIVKN